MKIAKWTRADVYTMYSHHDHMAISTVSTARPGLVVSLHVQGHLRLFHNFVLGQHSLRASIPWMEAKQSPHLIRDVPTRPQPPGQVVLLYLLMLTSIFSGIGYLVRDLWAIITNPFYLWECGQKLMLRIVARSLVCMSNADFMTALHQPEWELLDEV